MPRFMDNAAPDTTDAGWNDFDSTELPKQSIDWSAGWDDESSADSTPLKPTRAVETGTRDDATSTTVTTAAAITEVTRIDWNAGWNAPHGNPWADFAALMLDAPAAPPGLIADSGADAGVGGPEGFAKKGGGGGSTSGGGTTSGGTTSGSGSTSGSGTTTTSGTTTITTTTNTLTTLWQALNPPTGDTGTPADPYFSREWSLTSTTAGIDVLNAWANYTGKGVKVGIIDDGIDYTHTDLSPNYLTNLDYDATNGSLDAFGTSTDSHGTTVAGVIDAARNGTGAVGVAYNAGIAGFRISYSTGGPSQINDAFAHALANGMDIVNNSWGYTTAYIDNFFNSGFAGSKTAILNEVMYGRGGLGANVVFAAGNGRASGDNVNYHNYQNDPFVITVAATDGYGKVASFSTPGAALLVSAPGVGLYSDDRVGTAGYTSGDYASVAGTSYAAPAVAGVIALMLEANPNLGYRDVQQILAYSAKLTDPTSAGWQTNGAHDWNGGGLHFSQDYGFGLVDATAAVRLAESWQTQATYADMSTITAVHTDNTAVPDGTGKLSSQIQIGSSLTLDKVVVDLNITTASPSDLVVTLTSPSGTTATLASHPGSGTGTGIVFETSANNFWGEDAQGTWTLTVTDTVSGNAATLNGWTLEALGDVNAPHVYIYTDEFATAAGSGRSVLLDASGAVSINTAAVTSSSYLDLRPGAIDTIAGRALTIDASTIIKSAWAGDGNDTIIANDYGDTIQGGRGNDTITAGKGADILYGGPGSDTFAWNAVASTTDKVMDFAAGDLIDFHSLFAAIGYTGTNAVADGWLKLSADTNGTGTNFLVDAHDGHGFVALVDVVGVAPSLLKAGTDYLVHA